MKLCFEKMYSGLSSLLFLAQIDRKMKAQQTGQSAVRLSRGVRLRTCFTSLIWLFFCAPVVLAHEGRPIEPHDLWSSWTLEPLVVTGLLLSAALYTIGMIRMPKDRGPIHRWESTAFAAGWLALVIALVSPLDAMGGALFSAHMTQHEVLMLLAAPLLVLGRPLAPILLVLPTGPRQRFVRAATDSGMKTVWRWLVHPTVAWAIHAAALWAWHAPSLFQATLENEWIHAAQHLSFLVTAVLFYEAIVYGHEGRMGYGAAVVYLFTTAIHTSVLGALLTFSESLWYPAYQATTQAWGLTPLEDQQLGGLIMWVPAGVFYIVGGLTMFALWLRSSGRRNLVG